MTLARSSVKTMYRNESIGMSASGPLWRSKTTKCTCMSGNKKNRAKVRDKTVDLKETKDLYWRLIVLARSNRDVDQKQAVGTYAPRALIAPRWLSAAMQWQVQWLIHVLEKMETAEADQQSDEPTDSMETDEDSADHSRTISVVDGMVPSRFCWTHCIMAITRMAMMISSSQPPWCPTSTRVYHSDGQVSVQGGTARQIAAHASQRTYLAQISASAVHSVKMTITHTMRIVIQMKIVMTNLLCFIMNRD